MPNPALPLLLLLLSLPAAVCETCPVVLRNPRKPLSPRVIGGTDATVRTLSYIASLSHPNNSFACTGSLLSRRWLLTAAHCNVALDWRVRVGTRHALDGFDIPIRSIFVHEGYRRGVFDAPGDVALVELGAPAPPWATFVRVNSNASVPVRGSFARTAGYGRKSLNGQERNPAAHQVDAPVNSPVKCRRIYARALNVARQFFICVGYGKGGCQADSCNGDSGGPLIQLDSRGNPVQIGIVSFGMECGENGVPGVYVRMSSFVEWLVSKGAVFSTSADAQTVFGRGSEQAASDEVTTTLQVDPNAEGGTLVISTVWFIVICVIAGIAIIALIFVSLAYLSGSRRAQQEAGPGQPGYPTESTRGLQPQSPATSVDRDSLHLAISLLQGLANSAPSTPPQDTNQPANVHSSPSRNVPEYTVTFPPPVAPTPGTSFAGADGVTPKGNGQQVDQGETRR